MSIISAISKAGVSQRDLDISRVRMCLTGEINERPVWPDYSLDDLKDDDYDKVSLTDDSHNDIVSQMAREMATAVQFPLQTTFMHGLGILACAMTKGFRYKFMGSGPVTMYVITAQPPSTGKSGIHDSFFSPVRRAFLDYNEKQKTKQGQEKIKIKRIKDELKKCTNDNEEDALIHDLAEAESRLSRIPTYKPSITDGTPEGIAKKSMTLGGTFNIASDEANAINVVLGLMYGGTGKTNSEAILKAWDGEYVSITRAGADDIEGYLSGNVVVLAQDGAIQSVLEKAANGDGVPERFFLMEEKNLLGSRDLDNYTPPTDETLGKYARLVSKLVHTNDVTFTLSKRGFKMIMDRKREIEPLLADGQRYSVALMRGVAGKFDKRCVKLACVLHVSQNWDEKGGSDIIDDKCVERAIHICNEMLSTFEKSAKSEGHIGHVAECIKIAEVMQSIAKTGKLKVTCSTLANSVKKTNMFNGRKRLAKHILDNIAPRLESMGYCCSIGKDLHINPKLRF